MAIYNQSSIDRTFRALGDPSRRAMLAAICSNGSCTASELSDLFDSAQPTISKHIKVMEEAELIDRHVEGRIHHFRLNTVRLVEANQWVQAQLNFWENSLDQLALFLDETSPTKQSRKSAHATKKKRN